MKAASDIRLARLLQLASPAFGGIDTAARSQIMHQVVPATLHIPASGLARTGEFCQPEVNQGFL